MTRGTGIGAALALFAAAVVAAAPARADVDYFTMGGDPTVVTFHQGKSRTRNEKLLIGGLALGAVAAGGVGLYFHLDSRDAARDVSANHLTGRIWSADDQVTYDRAHRSGVKAIVGYSVGGLFLAAAAVAVWKTHPGDEDVKLLPGQGAPSVSPTTGGVVLGGVWSF